jgi:predicted ribosome quality control (RQC) complex YloA/Tae2 family protein
MASLRGLTGEDFQKELSAVIGSVLDDASLAIFGSFEQYANFGEGMLETVIRVVDTNEKINQAVKNMGLTVDLTKLYGVTEALTDAAGGLEEFLDQSKYFTENFLTEAERISPIQDAVIHRLAQLGFASVDTKTEFTALVKSLDLTSESGIDTYQSLMELAPGFNTVIKAVEDQSQALKDAASGFRDFITQIKNFKESLLLGASSTLTPQQKYEEARSQFEDVYAQAMAGDTLAMTKVTSSAQSFLEASRTYFASSEAYTSDFNSVLTKLDDATISAGASASVAERQLSALSIHTTLLSQINTNIATIAGVPKAARGGRVSGLTMVGELGPELVDFTYPAQVYPADQTLGMFATQPTMSSNMGQVVQELRQVKQELAQLRKEQQKQTGDLIMSNYDANQKASKEVASAVVNTGEEGAWINRSKSEIK